MLLNYDIVDTEKPDGICLPAFLVKNIAELFINPSIFSIKHSRSKYIINGALSDF